MKDYVNNHSEIANQKEKSNVVTNAESQVRTKHNNNEVIEAQKQMSSQETVGVPPTEYLP